MDRHRSRARLFQKGTSVFLRTLERTSFLGGFSWESKSWEVWESGEWWQSWGPGLGVLGVQRGGWKVVGEKRRMKAKGWREEGGERRVKKDEDK